MSTRDLEPILLVLLPGLDGTGLLFKPLVQALPGHIKPIVVRYPGDAHLMYHELFEIVKKNLPANEKFILLGESFSGPLSIMAAAQRPKNLAGLILCATFASSPRRFVRPAVRVMFRGPMFTLYRPYKKLKASLTGKWSPEYRQRLEQMHELVHPGVIAARLRMVFDIDVRPLLRNVQVPILYLAAAGDQVVPRSNLRRIQQVRPDINVITIGRSHMLLQRHAAEAAVAIADFVSTLK